MTRQPGTLLPGDIPATVPRVLAWAVQRWGTDHPVIEDGDGMVRLGELADQVARGVGVLRALGVTPGDRVAVSLPNDRTILETFLSTASAGAVWVGLHQHLSPADRDALVARCRPRVVVGTTSDRSAARGADQEWSVDRWRDAVGRAEPEPPAEVAPDTPTAIAWTSGTTGTPKGVVHGHRNLLVPAASFAWSGRVGLGERTGVAFPLTILNLVVQSILTALCAGATTCVLNRRDAAGILDLVDEHRVQQISIVPTTAFDIVHRGVARDVPSLQRVFIGGAHVDADLARAVAEALDSVVEHGYGLTEAPGLVTLGTIDHRPLTAGRPLPHVAVVIDEGEIVLRPQHSGPWAGVWNPPVGYWGQTEHGPGAGGAALELRTGDLGTLDDDGALTVLDRRSELIIRGGSNISPAEVEKTLDEHPSVAGVVVVGRRDDRLGHVPVAVVETALDPDELAVHCRARLAAYKVPEMLIVPTLQRNAMGKPDRAWARTLVDGLQTQHEEER